MAFPKNLACNKTFFSERWKNTKRPPLRTFTEMAEEFGLTLPQLRGHMAKSAHPAPAARIRSHGTSTSNSYYDRQEMRLWWALHSASRDAAREAV